MVCWTEKDQRNIYQAPMRAKEKTQTNKNDKEKGTRITKYTCQKKIDEGHSIERVWHSASREPSDTLPFDLSIFFIDIATMNLIYTINRWYSLFCFDVSEYLSLQPVFSTFLWIMLKIYAWHSSLLCLSSQILNPNPMRLLQLLYHLLLSLYFTKMHFLLVRMYLVAYTLPLLS